MPSEIERIAAAYPPEAAHTPIAERERYLTPVQQAAWDLRFGARADDRGEHLATLPDWQFTELMRVIEPQEQAA